MKQATCTPHRILSSIISYLQVHLETLVHQVVLDLQDPQEALVVLVLQELQEILVGMEHLVTLDHQAAQDILVCFFL